MASITIPETQLSAWASSVQLRKNTETYERVRNIFADFRPNQYEIYLQGSVANHTNIRNDGDIDIVFQFNGAFNSDASKKLTESDYRKFETRYRNISYTQEQFRYEIRSFLIQKRIPYESKTKCIKLNIRGEHWQDVDLVPCFQYRNYKNFDNYIEGMKIDPPSSNVIINYPKVHKKNGEEKNGHTGNYKRMVRIFKNIKTKLVNENYITEDLAPSYFIECLIYNIPDANFQGRSYTSLLENCLIWIKNNELKNLKCQNEITDLFGSNDTQWNISNCTRFIDESIKYVTRQR